MSVYYYQIRGWFIANAMLALAPNIHWSVNDTKQDILGIPATLFYFLFVASSITASIVFAYWVENRQGELQ
jgi:hypothetical protein